MKTCGLDVHKDSIFCAIYNGKEYSEVKEYATTTPQIRQMGEYLRTEGVEKVAMESPSTYWVPVWDVLLEAGFELMLVNPFLIKQMPGRKSDVKDAQRIACLLHKGLLRGSMNTFACYSEVAYLFPQIHQITGTEDPFITEDGQNHGYVRFPYRKLHEQSWHKKCHVGHTSLDYERDQSRST